ncbi:MAG TPA: hypothetical protein VGE43_18505, partial [Acidimicrobiales bacterium]
MALRTRKATGEVAFPMLLVEGGEKAGKTFTALQLAASERVGRTFVLELGERAADEYAALGRHEILDHNGTYSDIKDQLREAAAVPAEDGKPNVITFDSGSIGWDLLKDAASTSARNSKRARKILEDDPDADIEVTMPYWTKAKDKWWDLIRPLRMWPGITVITCRAGEVAKVVNGQPVANQTEWARNIEKGTPFAMTGIVRVGYPKPPTLVAVQSLHLTLPHGGLILPEQQTLEHLVFELLGGGRQFGQSPVVEPIAGLSGIDAKNGLWADACDYLQRDLAKVAAAKAWAAAGLDGKA